MSDNMNHNRFFSKNGPGGDLTVGQIMDKGINKALMNKHIYELSDEQFADINQKTNNQLNDILKKIEKNQVRYIHSHETSSSKGLNYLQFEKSKLPESAKYPWTQYYESGKGENKRVMNIIPSANLYRMGLSELIRQAA